jgi:hypothetical protein
MVSLVFDHISAHQAPYHKRFFLIQVQIRFYRPVRSATVRSLRRVTPFEPFTFLNRACRGHVGQERNTRCSGVYLAIEGLRRSGFEVDGVVSGTCGRESAQFFFTEDVCVLLILSGYCHRHCVLPCFGGEVGGYPSSVGTLLLELLEDCQFIDVG